MRNLIVLILLCVFVSPINAQIENIMASSSDKINLDFSTDPKWPDCVAPKAKFTINTLHDATVEIDEFQNEFEYQILLVNKNTTDSIIFVYDLDLIHTQANIFDFSPFIRTKCKENLISDWKHFKIIDNISDTRSDLECYELDIHYLYDNHYVYLTFMSPEWEHNNQIFNDVNNLNEHIYFEIEFLVGASGSVTKTYFSNDIVSDFINPNDPAPYLFVLPAILESSIKSVKVGSGNVNNCTWIGNSDLCYMSNKYSCDHNDFLEKFVFTDYPKNLINGSLFNCEPIQDIDYSTLCSYPGYIEGTINDTDLTLSFNGISQSAFQQQIDATQISKIEINITGISSNGAATTTIPVWDNNQSNFNITNWQEYVSGFGIYTTFIVSLNVYDKGGDIVSCNTYSEIPVSVASNMCDILGLLKIHPVNETTVKFDFIDNDNPNHLIDGLIEIGYSIAEAETYIESKLNYLDFNLSYSNGAEYQSTQEYVNLQNGIDLETFSVELDVNSINNFSGALQLEFTLPNGKLKKCLISPLNIEIEEEEEEGNEEIPTLDCNSIPPDLSSMSSELRTSEIKVGNVLTINGFPVVITSLSTSSQPISGEGIIPLPFKDKQLFVNIQSIQVNIDNQVIAGQVVGKNGPGIDEFPDFNLPPVYFGGDICVPPPVNGSTDASGIDPATGLNGYGFDPETGKHLNGTPYDYNGFDINGNHSDTGKPYNKDFCSRDGYLYQPNAEGDTVKTNIECDPTGGAANPVQLDSFINVLKPTIIDSISLVYFAKLEEFQLKWNIENSKCEEFRTDLKDPSKSLISNLIQGENNQYVDNVIENFSFKPNTFLTNENKNVKAENTENRHSALIGCVLDSKKYKTNYSEFKKVEDQELLDEIRDLILEKLESLSVSEFENLQTSVGLRLWILNEIYLFLENSNIILDLSSIEISNEYKNYSPEIRQSPYYATVSNDEPIRIEKLNVLKAMQFEYEQGFDNIHGHERAVVMQALRESQLSLGDPTIENLLPISIDTSFNKFDLSIMVSSVIFYPTSASMDIAAVLTDTENNQKIAFGAQAVPFQAGALNEEAKKLILLNDVGIRLNNAARLFLKSDQQLTFIEWDCNGFSSIALDGSIQFCREHVLPLNLDNEVIENDNVLYEVFIENKISNSLDFHFTVNAPPFELTTMRGYKWHVQDLGLDFSKDHIENLQINVPNDYISPYFDGTKLDDLWQGFYAKEVSVELPKNIFGGTTITASDILIDDTGFTGLIEKDITILPFEEGNANGWQLSVESINVLVLQNSIAGGGFGGRIGIPVIKEPLDYSATIYGENYIFTVSPSTDSLTFSPLGVDLSLKKNSYLQAQYSNDFGFEAKAHLNGTISLKEGSSLAEKINLPTFKFERLEMQNYKENGENKLRFTPGFWGVVSDNSDNQEEPKPLFSGFGLTLNELGIFSNLEQDGLFLAVDCDIELIENSLSGGGGFEIHGKMDSESSVFKMKYDDFKVKSIRVAGSIKSTLSVEGFVEWYEPVAGEADIYGKGFRGMVEAKFKKLLGGFGISAAAQFGTVNDHKYHFVDIIAELPSGVNIAGLSINKIGGGYMKGLAPDYTQIAPQAGFLDAEAFAASPIGSTLSGIIYTPSHDDRKEFKLMAGFHLAKEDIFNGTGEFIVKLSPTNSLDEIEIRAQGQFLKAPDPYSLVDVATLNLPVNLTGQDTELIDENYFPKPDNNSGAVLTGYAGFRYNFTKKEFSGKIGAYLNTPGGILSGAGQNGALCIVDIYFGRKDWWIWVGEPTPGKRAGINVDLAIIKAGLQGYFDIGTKIPPFPGLPSRVRHLGRDLNITESARTNEFAFAFGASFDFLFDASVAGCGVNVGVGAGFDVMLRKYNDLLCLDDDTGKTDEIGMNGWYAMGQAWAYLDGSLELFGFNIASAGVATVLQVQTPNPTWALAALEVEYDSFWTGEGTWKGEIEIGSRCNFTSENSETDFGLDLYANIYPFESQEDVGLEENIAFDFMFPLNDTIPQYQFLDGEDPGELTFQLDYESIKVLDQFGTVEFDMISDNNLNNLVFKPLDFFNENDSIRVEISIDILKNGIVYETQSKSFFFKTVNDLGHIPITNIEYEYPVNGMTNFHKDQYVKKQGYIKLIKGQTHIFISPFKDENGDDSPYNVVARFTSEYGDIHEEEVQYEAGNSFNNELTFSMNPDKFQNGTSYKLEIARKFGSISQNEEETQYKIAINDTKSLDKIYYTSYFRTSEYSSVEEKLENIFSEYSLKKDKDENTVRGPSQIFDIYLRYCRTSANIESFDYFDLLGDRPFVEFEAVQNPGDDRNNLDVFIFQGQNSWPSPYQFYEFLGYENASVYYTNKTLNNDYLITSQNFDNNSFTMRTDDLTFGLISIEDDEWYDLGIKYNLPGKESIPITDFYDIYFFEQQHLGEYKVDDLNLISTTDRTTEIIGRIFGTQ